MASGATPFSHTVDHQINNEDRQEEKVSTDANNFTLSLMFEVPLVLDKFFMDDANGPLDLTVDLEINNEDQVASVALNKVTIIVAILSIYEKGEVAGDVAHLECTIDPQVNGEDQWKEKTSTYANGFTSCPVPKALLMLKDYDMGNVNRPLDFIIDLEINDEDQVAKKVSQRPTTLVSTSMISSVANADVAWSSEAIMT